MVTTIAALAALWFTSQSLKANNDQFGLARQNAVTERFAKAVEQLGDKDRLDVRLGGIYLLGRLAADSPSDRPAIFDVLSAFVRTHTPNSPECGADLSSAIFKETVVSDDVRAVFTVIGRRDRLGSEKIDFSRTCFAGVDLSDLDLRGVSFRHANLTGAKLRSVDLDHADLSDTVLRWADMAGAKLTGASLAQAKMSNATLDGADLTAADLQGVDLRNAFVSDARMDRAFFDTADLRGAVFATQPLSVYREDVKDSEVGKWTAFDTMFEGAYFGLAEVDDQTIWPPGFMPTLTDRPH